MKKNIVLLLLTLLSASLFAAFQYEVVTEYYSPPSHNRPDGNYFVVNITSGTGDLYIVDKIDKMCNVDNNNEVLKNVMSDYGYINMKTNEYSRGTWETMVVKDKREEWGKNIYQTGYKLGKFSEGDSIGIWIDNKQMKGGAERSTSVHTEFFTYGTGYKLGQQDMLGTDLAQLAYDKNPKTIYFGFHKVESPTFGQPLPGMLPTFLLGGSVLGAVGLKRRRNRA